MEDGDENYNLVNVHGDVLKVSFARVPNNI